MTTLTDRREHRPAMAGGRTFEELYRANLGAVTAFFARRAVDPQLVADLTSETFMRALGSIGTFEGRGSERAWLIAIARAVYAQYWADIVAARDATSRLAGQVALADDEIQDLAGRIDAHRAGRELLEHAASLSGAERDALELVDLVGMTPREAAETLQISAGALRVRLFRARAHLRKQSPQLKGIRNE